MHAMTDLDCEKYRHPDTARARRRDTYADHGVSEDERGDLAAPPHPLAALPALGRRGVAAAARRRGAGDRRRHLAGRAHARALARPRLPVVPGAPDVLLSGRPPAARHHPAGDLRARVRRRPAAQLPDVAAGRSPTCGHAGAARPRHARSAIRRGASRRSCAPRCGGWRRSAARSASSRARSSSSPTCSSPRRSSPTSASSRSTRRSRTWPTCAGPGSWSGGPGPDGVYEWYATADTPLDVAALSGPLTGARKTARPGRRGRPGRVEGRAVVSAPARPHPWSGCGGTRRAAPEPRSGCRGRSCGSGRSPA